MSPTVVLDDDPTGAQLEAGVPVVLAWTPAEVAAALAIAPGVHLLTNSRALDPAAAYAVTSDAARTARAAAPDCRLVLRGDSTLRGHLVEEYDAVREVAFEADSPALLLVPALPSAGRVTRNGTHYVVSGHAAVPVHTTEYAHDGSFSYRSSRLVDWADERSGGRFAAARGREVVLAQLRQGGAAAVASALAAAGSAGAVVAVDAETMADLEVVRTGLIQAEDDGVAVVTRCAPAFAAVLTGRLAHGRPSMPPNHSGVLVVCGSYVANSTRQLAALERATGVRPVEVTLDAVGDGTGMDDEASRLAEAAVTSIARTGLAVLATPRSRPPGPADLASGRRIASVLAGAVSRVRPAPSIVVAKGGVTSATVVREGLGVRTAQVVGPLRPGISLWHCPGRPAVVVFPGNVGGPDDLADLVLGVLGARWPGDGLADRRPQTGVREGA